MRERPDRQCTGRSTYVTVKTNILIDEGKLEDTTKNRAVVEAALRALHRIKKGERMEIRIHTESEYFIRILKDLNRSLGGGPGRKQINRT